MPRRIKPRMRRVSVLCTCKRTSHYRRREPTTTKDLPKQRGDIVLGYYDSGSKEIAVACHDGNTSVFARNVRHESTHYYLHSAYRQLPGWPIGQCCARNAVSGRGATSAARMEVLLDILAPPVGLPFHDTQAPILPCKKRIKRGKLNRPGHVRSGARRPAPTHPPAPPPATDRSRPRHPAPRSGATWTGGCGAIRAPAAMYSCETQPRSRIDQ